MTASHPDVRVLFYGMQSSGASLLTYLAAQGSQTLAVIDLWNPEVAPALSGQRGCVVLKATTGPIDLDVQIDRFKPTATVLVLRHPVDQIAALTRRSYRDYASPLEEKLATFDRLFSERASEFTLVLSYEGLVMHPERVAGALTGIGLDLPPDAHEFPRALTDIVSYAREQSSWCQRHWRTKWGTGRVDPSLLAPLSEMPVSRTAEALALAQQYCPTLSAHYA